MTTSCKLAKGNRIFTYFGSQLEVDCTDCMWMTGIWTLKFKKPHLSRVRVRILLLACLTRLNNVWLHNVLWVLFTSVGFLCADQLGSVCSLSRNSQCTQVVLAFGSWIETDCRAIVFRLQFYDFLASIRQTSTFFYLTPSSHVRLGSYRVSVGCKTTVGVGRFSNAVRVTSRIEHVMSINSILSGVILIYLRETSR